MEHVFFSLAEFVLVLGGIGIFLTVLFFLGLGLAARAIAQMFSGRPAQTPPVTQKATETERLRQQLFEAQNTAYESALASEKTIQQLQQRIAALEASAGSSVVSVCR